MSAMDAWVWASLSALAAGFVTGFLLRSPWTAGAVIFAAAFEVVAIVVGHSGHQENAGGWLAAIVVGFITFPYVAGAAIGSAVRAVRGSLRRGARQA